MFVLYADKTRLTMQEQEPVTSGSIGVYHVRFCFSPDWDGMNRTAVFRAGGRTVSVLLDETSLCTIPWEVLVVEDCMLSVGVYGERDGNLVLPTVWTNLGTIHEGVRPGIGAHPPTPDLWRQELAQKQDKFTGQPGQFVGFDEEGRAVPVNVVPGENENCALPIATKDTLGGVKIGKGMSVDEDGTIAVDGIAALEDAIASDESIEELLDEIFGKNDIERANPVE